MVFLALLALALGGTLAFFLILVGLFEAPWPVLLGGLLVAFFGLQWLSNQNQTAELEADPPNPTRSAAEAAASAHPMGDELVYRGIRYTHVQSDDDAATTETTMLEGTYRGQRWQRSVESSAAESESVEQIISEEIIYRGRRVKRSKPTSSSNG